MPIPSSRIDLVVVPRLEDDADGGDRVWSLGLDRQWWGADGRAAACGADVVVGGFVRAWVETWARPYWYANQQGGVRARCPACGRPVARELARVLARHRVGGDRDLACEACGWRGDVTEVDVQPPAALASAALVLADVQDIVLSASASAALSGVWPDLRTVLRRVR